ncbi:MAG: hypothetical protein WDN44_13475 [Sphingomonas sp.]
MADPTTNDDLAAHEAQLAEFDQQIAAAVADGPEAEGLKDLIERRNQTYSLAAGIRRQADESAEPAQG